MSHNASLSFWGRSLRDIPENSYRDYAGGKRGNLNKIYFVLFFLCKKADELLLYLKMKTIETDVFAFLKTCFIPSLGNKESTFF